MNWIRLQSIDQLAEIQTESKDNPVLIFKHSTTCSVSRVAMARLERGASAIGEIKTYFLDLHANRELSDQIEKTFHVRHESPQVLIVSQRKVVFHRSHFDIEASSIQEFLSQCVLSRN